MDPKIVAIAKVLSDIIETNPPSSASTERYDSIKEWVDDQLEATSSYQEFIIENGITIENIRQDGYLQCLKELQQHIKDVESWFPA